jgi:hypothetical protein
LRWNCSGKARFHWRARLNCAALRLAEFMGFAAEREVPLHYTLGDLAQDRQLVESLSP